MKRYNNTLEIVDEQIMLRKQAISIVDLAKAESRELTEDEQKQYDYIKEELKRLDEEKEDFEKKMNEEPVEPSKDEEEDEKDKKETKSVNSMNKFVEELRSGKREFTIELRDINATTATEGKEGISTNATLVDALRNRLVLAQAGATILDGLTGNERFAVYSGATASWVGETAQVTDGSGTFTSVDLSPKRLSVTVPVSGRWLHQTGGEQMIINDLINAISEKLESTILGSGAGGTNEPKGLFNGITADTAALTVDKLYDLEADVETNKDTVNAYILNPRAKALIRALKPTDNATAFSGNEVLGVKAFSTGNVVNKGILVGNMSELCIGLWNSVSVIVDPYTGASKDQIYYTVNLSVDAVVRRSSSIKAYICK